LAAAAAIAEYPERIKKIFENKEYSTKGIFAIKVFIAGEERTVTFDDRIPVRSYSSRGQT